MNGERKTNIILTGLTLTFSSLALVFLFKAAANPRPHLMIADFDPAFTNTATVRTSAAELIRTGGDASGLDCYVCHDKSKPVQVHWDTNHNILLPDEHKDLVLRHGRNNRNNDCFNCHDPSALDRLKTRDGRELKLTESTQLCGSCHGPTYRDWEVGIHGRTSGFWDRKLGAIIRQDCVSCHDPHSPAFPALKPTPGPQPLHSDAASPKAPPLTKLKQLNHE